MPYCYIFLFIFTFHLNNNNMKKQKQNRFLLLLLVMISSISFAQRNQLEVNPDFGDGSVYYGSGPSESLNFSPSMFQGYISSDCLNNNIMISTSGTTTAGYAPPLIPANTCFPDASAPSSNIAHWTSSSSNGFITYTFSQPITSAKVTYAIVDPVDVGAISINAPGIQLSEPCGLTINNNIVSCNFSYGYGDVSLRVSSNTPFTTITLTNIGGSAGWVTGNPCNFIIYNDIVVVGKVSYDFCANYISGSIYDGATINGIPLNPSNATLVEVIPPLGIPGVAYNQVPIQGMPQEISIVNGDLFILPLGPGYNAEFFVQICANGSCSLPIRINVFTCANRLALDEIKISPNPSKDGLFSLLLENEINVGNLEVFNFNGEIVFSKNIEKEKEFIINLENQPKGTFVLKISDGEETITKNLVIQ